MEPAAAWSFEQANNWTMEPAAWSPGFPAESEYSEIYVGSWMPWIQTCAPNNNSVPGQLIEYIAAAAQHYQIAEKEGQQESLEVVVQDSMEMETHKGSNDAISALEEVAREFEADTEMVKEKLHRYPETIRGLDLSELFTVPRVVAIGPYHRSRQQVEEAERVKYVAAYHCIKESGCSAQQMFDAVVSSAAAADARRLYDEDVMALVGDEHFQHMMFVDACFLVEFMVWYAGDKGTEDEMDPSLCRFFHSKLRAINHDIWLLENQLPWRVVEAVMKFRFEPQTLRVFINSWRNRLQDLQSAKDSTNDDFALDSTYDPPHLLGLLRHHIVVGRSSRKEPKDAASLSFSVSAIELAEIGITLKGKGAAGLADMGLKKGVFFAELSLTPLTLNYARASRLVNMAAFELCATAEFADAEFGDSAVCSYLLLLSMLVHKEEDVHELRKRGVLQGGAGLTNKQALDLFTSFQSLPDGRCYTSTMKEIQCYRNNRKMLIKLHVFWYKNKETILRVIPIASAVLSVLGTLVGILVKLKGAS